MIYLTEQQRLEALDTCDRIEALNAKIQFHANEALKILDRIANPTREPREGDSVEGDLTGEA